MLSLPERRARRKAHETTRRVRIENLRRLAESAGSISNLARLLGLNENVLKAMIGANATRSIEDSLARDLEYRANLPEHYLDQDHKCKMI